MSRTSRVPYHQNVYDMLSVVLCDSIPKAEDQIVEWEQRTGRTFPAAMREFYTTSVTLRLGESTGDWTLLPHELWSEYSNSDRAYPVPVVFEPFVPSPHSRTPAPPVPGFELISENQGVWVMCARADGGDDPVVDVSGPCFLCAGGMWGHDRGWHALGTSSEVLAAWFAEYYDHEFTPLSYNGNEGYELGNDPKLAPPKPYCNGLWLRTPADPFAPAVIDYLAEAFDEPERTPRPGNVTTYTFRPPGGTVRITADEPGLGGALSAWWIHADTPERLAELSRLILPFGTLRDTLRADTEPARVVLNTLRSTAEK